MKTSDQNVSLFDRIYDNRKWFYICLPVCLVVCVLLTYTTPKFYESRFIVAGETQQAVEVNRAITLNQPANYDLGVARTDNMIKAETYSKLLQSDTLIYACLQEEVSTLDGKYSGTVGHYLTYYFRNNLKGKITRLLLEKKNSDKTIGIDPLTGVYTPTAVEMIDKLRGLITCEIDWETKLVTVSCTAQDPKVAMQIARAVCKHMYTTIDEYELQKMQGVLAQLTAQADQAEKEWMQAKEDNRMSEVETLKNVAGSFRRQQVVYEAQMIHHPAFVVVSEPSFEYRKAGPSRVVGPVIFTFFFGLLMLMWIGRKEIIAYIKG